MVPRTDCGCHSWSAPAIVSPPPPPPPPVALGHIWSPGPISAADLPLRGSPLLKLRGAYESFCTDDSVPFIEIALRSASSMHWANLTALARVSFASVKSFRRALSLRSPHTKRSRSASSKNAPNSHEDASRRSSAMYSALMPGFLCENGNALQSRWA